MSRLFGDIRQIAFVVRDIDQAMQYWTKVLGGGPFFVKREIELDDYRYHGKEAASPFISIALANSGSLQVELIQQHDERPSIYREFLESGREGFQHVSAWVTRTEFDVRRAELLSSGVRLAQEGTIPVSGVRLAYFGTEEALEASSTNSPTFWSRGSMSVCRGLRRQHGPGMGNSPCTKSKRSIALCSLP